MHTSQIINAFEARLRNSQLPRRHQARAFNMLKETISDLRISVKAARISDSKAAQDIIRKVAEAAEVTPAQVQADTRGRGMQARLLSMYFLRQWKFSYAEIGHYFERDHTTVIRSVKVVKNRLDTGDVIMVRFYDKYKQMV